MSRQRIKKVLLLLLKIAILIGLLEYVRRQAQLGDEIAVSGPKGGAEMEAEPVQLRALDGSTLSVPSGARLKVVLVRPTSDGAPLAYQATTPEGVVVEIPAADVDGSSARAVASPARFSLLPGLGTLF